MWRVRPKARGVNYRALVRVNKVWFLGAAAPGRLVSDLVVGSW